MGLVGRCPALASDSLPTSALGSSVRLCSLASHRQAAPVTLASVALDIYQSADIHLIFTSKVTFDRDACTVDAGSDACQVLVAQVAHPPAGFDA